MEKPEIQVSSYFDPLRREEMLTFTAIFSRHAATQMGGQIMKAAAELVAKEVLAHNDLKTMIDTDKLSHEITDAIGRMFVEKLLGKKEDQSAEPKK